MPKFFISTNQNIGFRHSGGEVFAEGTGEVELTDEEVRQLVELIKENDGKTDVDALGLKGKYPELYKKLDEAYTDVAFEARYRQLCRELFEGGYMGEPVDDLIKYCEDNLGYEFEYDEDDFRDPETGELDEEELADEKADDFWRFWIYDYYDSLTEDEQVNFITTHFDCDDIVADDYDYDLVIPEEIVKIAKEEMK